MKIHNIWTFSLFGFILLIASCQTTSGNANQLTEQEELHAQNLERIYTENLIASIKQLDDKITPANLVARAAIAQNIQQLRDWKRADTAYVNRSSNYKIRLYAEMRINQLPSQSHVDQVTSIVLMLRQKDNS